MSGKVIVAVEEGRIRGIKTTSTYNGAEYYSFFGVPYGQSTAGQARFKDPTPVKPWKGIMDCTTEKEGCIQFSITLDRLAGSEDCLYHNIHTPELPKPNDPLKPVIVLVHPGGTYHGSPETYCFGSPEYLMNRDIVYVCVAYRLHILGFLNLNLPECSGNQGIKDIILGLRWIQKNIRTFGGDPENVTLLGSSSGSGLANIIMYSTPSRELIHKAVIMGMYSSNPTVVVRGENASLAFEIAKSLGYDGNNQNDMRKLLQFYKKLDIKKFIAFRTEIKYNKKLVALFPCTPFLPLYGQNVNDFFAVKGRKIYKETARVPLMVGICDKEAVMGFTRIYKKTTMENFYTSYRQNYWGWGSNVSDEEVKFIKQQMDSYYFNGKSIEDASLSELIDVQTDIAYSEIYDTLIDIVSADLPESVFVYKFEFEGNAGTVRDRIEPLLDEPIRGTFHSADFSYWSKMTDLWGGKTASRTLRTRQMIDKFTKLICTFARTGNPNHDELEVYWRPSNPRNRCYLNIADELTLVDGKLNGPRMQFWDSIKKQYGASI